jgi:hypothetical protein
MRIGPSLASGLLSTYAAVIDTDRLTTSARGEFTPPPWIRAPKLLPIREQRLGAREATHYDAQTVICFYRNVFYSA